jgi:murein DD-endopeptidase MepM/ murein hydrolase activator NlpD
MKRLIVFALIALLFSCSSENVTESADADLQSKNMRVSEFGFPDWEYDVEEGRIKRGDYFSSLLGRLGISASQAYEMSVVCENVFDLKTIKVGNTYRAYYTKDPERRLEYLVYQDTKTRFVTFSLGDSLYASINERAVTSRVKYGEAVINTSLWNDVMNAGLNPVLAIRLSEIYAWSIDFFGLRPGDSFKVLYEEQYVGDEFYDIGRIYSAVFTHMGKSYDAYRFVQDSVPQYWSGEGENLRKAFLKAPLSFTRVSSGFSYARRHPITRIVRPHTGVDYAAPSGTPVMSIGDGVVVQRAYTRGGGNQVKIKHNSVYTTAYLHLSGFARGLSVGKRVSQGEVIGYVGSTGMSTGPHLDFRVWKNGSPINPLTMEAPPADPLKESNRPLFAESIERIHAMRDSVLSVGYVDSLLLGIGVQRGLIADM